MHQDVKDGSLVTQSPSHRSALEIDVDGKPKLGCAEYMHRNRTVCPPMGYEQKGIGIIVERSCGKESAYTSPVYLGHRFRSSPVASPSVQIRTGRCSLVITGMPPKRILDDRRRTGCHPLETTTRARPLNMDEMIKLTEEMFLKRLSPGG